MTISRRTPKGWVRVPMNCSEIEPLIAEAKPHLAGGKPVDAVGWYGPRGQVRRISIEFENGATWTLKIDRDGRQSVEEQFSLKFELEGKGEAA